MAGHWTVNFEGFHEFASSTTRVWRVKELLAVKSIEDPGVMQNR